eukprot:gene15570-biopygen14268
MCPVQSVTRLFPLVVPCVPLVVPCAPFVRAVSQRASPPRALAVSQRASPPRALAVSQRASPPRALAVSQRASPPKGSKGVPAPYDAVASDPATTTAEPQEPLEPGRIWPVAAGRPQRSGGTGHARATPAPPQAQNGL